MDGMRWQKWLNILHVREYIWGIWESKRLALKGRQVTHHLSRLEWFFIKVCEAGAVFWKPITVLQLLRVTRGLVPAWGSILDTKDKQGGTKETLGILHLHLLTSKRLNLHRSPQEGPGESNEGCGQEQRWLKCRASVCCYVYVARRQRAQKLKWQRGLRRGRDAESLKKRWLW